MFRLITYLGILASALLCLSLAYDVAAEKKERPPIITLAWEVAEPDGTVTFDVQNVTRGITWEKAKVTVAAKGVGGASYRFRVPSPPSMLSDNYAVRACFPRSRTCSAWSALRYEGRSPAVQVEE